MKKITLLFYFMTAFFGFSQNIVSVNQTDITNGYVNAFNESDLSYAFGFSYPTSSMKTTFPTSNSVVLAPNFAIWDENDDTPTDGGPAWDPAWFSAPNTPNKIIEAISYAENNALLGSDLTFIGTVDAVTLDAGYTAKAFIKVLDSGSGYATVYYNAVDLTVGDFTVSATAAELGVGDIVQYGFVITGLIANPADEAALGTVNVSARSLSTNDFNLDNFSVFPNPTKAMWTVKTNAAEIKSVLIFDILGKQVMSLNPNTSEVKIDGIGLSKGLYFAKITTEKGSGSLKLIKN